MGSNTKDLTYANTATSIAVLPLELLDLVFEWVLAGEYPKQAIFACSLVSSYWEVVSRRQRFRKMSLSIDDDPAETLDCIRWESFAASPGFSGIAPRIRKLALSFGKAKRNDMHGNFLDILLLLPRLHTLELQGRFDQRISVDPSPAVVDATRRLTRLDLTGRCLQPPALCDLLSLFSNVEELDLSRIRNDSTSPGETTGDHHWPYGIFPNLETLALGPCVYLVDLLSLSPPGLKSLNLGPFKEAYHPYLRELAPTLEHLEVHQCPFFNLGNFPALRTLTLRDRRNFRKIASTLATLPRPYQIRSFTLLVDICSTFRSADFSDVRLAIAKEQASLRAIEAVLVRWATEGSLQHVMFEIHRGCIEVISAPALFAETFPRLVKLGVLEVPHTSISFRYEPL